jgi:hypothetical protein
MDCPVEHLGTPVSGHKQCDERVIFIIIFLHKGDISKKKDSAFLKAQYRACLFFLSWKISKINIHGINLREKIAIFF